MVVRPTNRQGRHPIFPRNPTHIRPKTPLQLQREGHLALLRRENTVKQGGAIGMRHREQPPSEYHTAPTGRCNSLRPDSQGFTLGYSHPLPTGRFDLLPWPNRGCLVPNCEQPSEYHTAPTGRCSSPRPNPRVSPWAIFMPSLREAWAACLTGPQYHAAPTGRCSSPRPNPRVSPWAIFMPSLREVQPAALAKSQLAGPQMRRTGVPTATG